MVLWTILIYIKIFISFTCYFQTINAGFLHSVLGIPTECVHHNVIITCKLSITCWLQGGTYAQGCGKNKWLFSCCITETNLQTMQMSIPQTPPNFQIKKLSTTSIRPLPKRTMFRRTDEDNEILQQMNCGMPRIFEKSIQKRIIGGRPARFAEYPWQAHIRIAEFQCGGVLVSKRFVATAAHCIQQASLDDITVYLGELDTQNSGAIIEPVSSEKYRIVEKFIHPRFQFRVTQPDRFDLALLKLAKPTGYSSHILPICLPSRPIELIGKKGLIAGWGKTAANIGHSGTNILHAASVPIIGTDDCIRWHKSKQINVEIFSEMFCAGHSDGHQDACLGDSGGPLIIKEQGRYTLIGIISAGFGCGIDHQPGIYHNIQKTTKWIQNAILRNR